jgi:hypothetical protein
MKDYYRILNVRQTASPGEIKRSYRLLVQQFHPDVNPDPTAHELIKEINEAYDVLGDELKRREYDVRLTYPFVAEEVPQPPPHRDPAYHRRGRYRPAPTTGTTQQDLMQKYVHVASYIAWVGCILCLVLVIDYSLPYKMTTDSVQNLPERRIWAGTWKLFDYAFRKKYKRSAHKTHKSFNSINQ